MSFPIADSISTSITPYVNWAIIAINVGVHFSTFSKSAQAQKALIQEYGLVPTKFSEGLAPFRNLITSTFLHANLLHLASNMSNLHIFGDNVEETLGHLGYIAFYACASIVTDYLFAQINRDISLPVIGASGAVSAVLGFYWMRHSNGTQITYLTNQLESTFIGAENYLLSFFLTQIVSFAIEGRFSPIAFLSHIIGFLFGIFISLFFK